MNVNVTFGQSDSAFPVKIGATDNSMDVDFGSTQLIKGDDGISPTVDITPIDGGHRISITDKDGTETADVMDGDPGADGISPTVAVQDITGGHRVTITDKDGEKTFDVMDGKDGEGGAGGAAVQSDWRANDESDPAHVKNRTHWLERPYEPIVWDGSTEGRDSIDVSFVFGAPAGSLIAYKISDRVLTKDEILVSHVDALGRMGEVVCEFKNINDLVPDAIWSALYRDDQYEPTDNTYFNTVQGVLVCTVIAGDFTSSMGVVIPSVGTYVLYDNETLSASYTSVNADAFHTIDKRYLPDAFATEEYVDNAISQAITGAIGGSY